LIGQDNGIVTTHSLEQPRLFPGLLCSQQKQRRKVWKIVSVTKSAAQDAEGGIFSKSYGSTGQMIVCVWDLNMYSWCWGIQ